MPLSLSLSLSHARSRFRSLALSLSLSLSLFSLSLQRERTLFLVIRSARSWISAKDDQSAHWVCIWLGLGIFLENVSVLDCVVLLFAFSDSLRRRAPLLRHLGHLAAFRPVFGLGIKRVAVQLFVLAFPHPWIITQRAA